MAGLDVGSSSSSVAGLDDIHSHPMVIEFSSPPTMLDVVKVVLITMKDEILDVKKSTYYNLSVSGN